MEELENPLGPQFVINMKEMKEHELSLILKSYNLNPIILWEIILKQSYDKVVEIDEETILYNLQLLADNSLDFKVVKIIHLVKINVVFVITDLEDG